MRKEYERAMAARKKEEDEKRCVPIPVQLADPLSLTHASSYAID